MCKAFSCIVKRDAKVIWKLGKDSHTELLEGSGLKDDTADPALMEFARVEITPNNGDYLFPDAWTLRVDQSITPQWFGEKHREIALACHRVWLKKLDKILVRKQIMHPFKIETPKEITKQHINMLRKWDSVRASVGASVWDSVWDSVGDSVRAYVGSFFLLPAWKYVKHPRGKYPFSPCVKLWEQGLVPSFDGKTWRLHAGPKAAVVFEITAEDLKK